MKLRKGFMRKLSVFSVFTLLMTSLGQTVAYGNYTMNFYHSGKGTDHGKPVWNSSNSFPNEGISYDSTRIGDMLEEIQTLDKANLAQNVSDLPWIDELLVNEGIIPDDQYDDVTANTLFSRGSALYMKTQDNSKLGFVGQVYYADTLNQNSMYTINITGQTLTESKNLRKNYPSHANHTYTSNNLLVNSRKFITYGNTAVTLLDIKNTSSSTITITLNVTSPFATTVSGNELYGEKVAAPLMVGTGTLSNYVTAMSYVDVRLSGDNMQAASGRLSRTITLSPNQTISQKVVMGWIAEEIPQSQIDYDRYKAFTSNDQAFRTHVIEYNEWWSENIPYIDIPDKNVKKVLYYRWWCNRFNLLDANIPGNDWQFPMNMEGVLGYNNGITVSVAWALQDLKWLRNPLYAYGTWLSQGEYSEGSNYKNNPGRPNTWTWDMMQNISQVGWEAYKIHGGGREILGKFANMARDDVYGTLSTFGVNGTRYDNNNLVFYNHGPMTGNDGDTVSMHFNGGGSFARVDGSSTNYANALATAQMYEALGNTALANEMYNKANQIRTAMLQDLWFDGNDFDNDGIPDTNGSGSFLHRQASTGLMNPWRDNNLFAFSFGVVPTAKESAYNPKYLTQLYDYADPNYYPIFPFFTADQTSIEKRIQAWINGSATAYGTNQLAFCNFGNYINVLRKSLREYPVSNITADTYKTLLDWGAWLHTVEPGNTDHLDANEFFWLENYFFGINWTKTNPPRSTGNLVRAWIHHDTLGMMDYTVIEDVAGLVPRADHIIELWPLGVDYDYFAVDNIRYHGKDLSIIWQDPSKPAKYNGIPTGYSLYIDGVRMFTVDSMVHLTFDPTTGKVSFPTGDVAGAVGNNANARVLFQINTPVSFETANEISLANNERIVDMFNKAGVDIVNDGVNLATASTTTITATGVNSASNIRNLANGDTAVTDNEAINVANYITSFKGSSNAKDSITFDFGSNKTIDNVKLYFFNNRLKNGYAAPESYELYYRDEQGTWQPIAGQIRSPLFVKDNYNNVEFLPVNTRYFKVEITHKNGFSTALTELQVYFNNLDLSIENTAPVINMEDQISVALNETLNLVPVVVDDGLPNGNNTYQWTLVSKPSNGNVSASSYTDAKLQASFDQVGDYVFDFTVSDGELSTTKRVTITVYVSVDAALEIINKYSNTTYLTINTDDFSTSSWNNLQQVIANAKNLINSGNYTESQIAAITQQLQAAANNLEYINIARLATASTNYVSPWENLAAVNDGYIPLAATKDDNKGDIAYGNWGGPDSEYYVEYTWTSPATISSASTYFYNDGGGIGLPGSYRYQYYNSATNAYEDVKNPSTYSKNNARFNTVTFTPVTTTKFRIVMTKASSSVWNGIKEFRVSGTVAQDPQGNIVSVAPTSVETIVNVQPILPTHVTVTYQNGTTGQVPVTWEAINPNLLTTATNFTITGTISGSDLAATCTVYVKYDKSGLLALIEQASTMERSDYPNATNEQWTTFINSYQAAISCYENDSATEGDISTATSNLNAAIQALIESNGDITLTNIALSATASSTYTSSWNSVAAVNDGLVSANNKSNIPPDGTQASVYGNWGSNASQSVTLTWTSPKTISSSSILFYDNREGDPIYNGEGSEDWIGVAVPISYTYEYLDANGNWVMITDGSGYGNQVDAFNTTTFARPIITRAIRITMHRNNLGTGIIEWRVMGY